jgi:hypothetical protein
LFRQLEHQSEVEYDADLLAMLLMECVFAYEQSRPIYARRLYGSA